MKYQLSTLNRLLPVSLFHQDHDHTNIIQLLIANYREHLTQLVEHWDILKEGLLNVQKLVTERQSYNNIENYNFIKFKLKE